MDRKQMMAFAVIGAALLCLAVTAVTATPRIASSTPLYTIRMEQASNKMSFLPTQQNAFAYSIENRYTVDLDISAEYCDAQPLGPSCEECQTDDFTCPWATCYNTCDITCGSTCANTCGSTCVSTCSTCVNTCPNTCQNTCGNTCGYTCPGTCHLTCSFTCWTC